MRIKRDFYMSPAYELAPLLLGKFLCRCVGETVTRVRITETEAYYSETDTACHAHKGRTVRTSTLYTEGGTAYVYLCYGIHNLLNVVSGPEGHPEAVLIRGVEGHSGPGRLTKALSIDRRLNGQGLCVSGEMWLEDDGVTFPHKTTPRIGINYATPEYRDKPWRFVRV